MQTAARLQTLMRREGAFEMWHDSPRMLPRFITPTRIDVECSIKSQVRPLVAATTAHPCPIAYGSAALICPSLYPATHSASSGARWEPKHLRP